MRIIEILPGIRLVCGKGIPDMEDQRSREVRIAKGVSPAGSAASLVVSSCRGAAIRFQENVAEKSLSERFPQMNLFCRDLQKPWTAGELAEAGGFRSDYTYGLRAVYRLIATQIADLDEPKEEKTFQILGASAVYGRKRHGLSAGAERRIF